jgi:hypothetical protein
MDGLQNGNVFLVVLVREHRLGVYENRVTRISRPKREEVTGDGRKLYNEDLIIYTFRQSAQHYEIGTVRWAGYTAPMGEMINEHKCW